MFGKAFTGLCCVAAPAAYLMSGSGGIDRTVGASPDDVRSALMDLDIRNAPGAPASDPSRSGGVAPLFQLTQEGDDMVWTVTSGDKVAVRMIAHLEPVAGGRQTRVTAKVERGDAPDDFVAPAFRSKGLTLGLFSMVLEDELDDLVRPAGSLSADECRELAEKLLSANAPPIEQQSGFGGVARTAMTLGAVESELKFRGCDTGFKSEFAPVSSQMSDDGGAAGGGDYQAGRPMTDLSSYGQR